MTIAHSPNPARAELVEALPLLCTQWKNEGQPFDKLRVGGFFLIRSAGGKP